MPGMPKLDRVLELRFYRQTGVTSRTIFARLESNVVEYQGRSSPQRTVRKRYRVRFADDILTGIFQAEVNGPVRVVDQGVELVVNRVEELERRKMLFIDCEGIAQRQPAKG